MTTREPSQAVARRSGFFTDEWFRQVFRHRRSVSPRAFRGAKGAAGQQSA